jgi:DNA-binding transcriptional regulator/RsmH inhibitor MraZ
MPDFWGIWPYMMDERLRVPIPPKFRLLFKDHRVFLYVVDGKIKICREEKIYIDSKNLFILEIDSHGRIKIPERLKNLVSGLSSGKCSWESERGYLVLVLNKEPVAA